MNGGNQYKVFCKSAHERVQDELIPGISLLLLEIFPGVESGETLFQTNEIHLRSKIFSIPPVFLVIQMGFDGGWPVGVGPQRQRSPMKTRQCEWWIASHGIRYGTAGKIKGSTRENDGNPSS